MEKNVFIPKIDPFEGLLETSHSIPNLDYDIQMCIRDRGVDEDGKIKIDEQSQASMSKITGGLGGGLF